MKETGPSHDDAPLQDRSFGIAISRAFGVLQCFTPERPLLGNSDIVRMTGLPKATVSRLTFTLEELGYLYRLVPIGKYRLGWGVVSLGYPLLTSMGLRQIARPAMHALAMQARVNVNMGTLHGLGVVYVEAVRFDETSLTRPDIGARRELLSSSIGRALIWGMETPRRDALLNRARLASPEVFRNTKAKLEQARRSILARGFCVSDGETQPGYQAVSVPMRVASHEEPIAFNCAVPTYQLRKGEIEQGIGPKLVAMVRTLENQLGVR
ncbi:HTH-type transcriptional regulator TsaQ1/TsaQ2 [compost metagenome]